MPSISPTPSDRRTLTVGLAAFLLGGCAAAKPRTLHVTVAQMAFTPKVLQARVGDTVVWTNNDIVPHTATAAGGFDIDLPVKGGGQTALNRPGTIDYACSYHPSMTGRIVVT